MRIAYFIINIILVSLIVIGGFDFNRLFSISVIVAVIMQLLFLKGFPISKKIQYCLLNLFWSVIFFISFYILASIINPVTGMFAGLGQLGISTDMAYINFCIVFPILFVIKRYKQKTNKLSFIKIPIMLIIILVIEIMIASEFWL